MAEKKLLDKPTELELPSAILLDPHVKFVEAWYASPAMKSRSFGKTIALVRNSSVAFPKMSFPRHNFPALRHYQPPTPRDEFGEETASLERIFSRLTAEGVAPMNDILKIPMDPIRRWLMGR